MDSLKSMVDKSGDSVIDKYSYLEGTLILDLDITELEKKIRMTIKTDALSFDNYYLSQRNEIYKVCRIEIQELASVMSMENNIYIPPNNFGDLMKESRLNYNLAYGKSKSDVKYIFSLTGYGRLVSCLLFDLSYITIEEI